jgi:hypothetical protein
MPQHTLIVGVSSKDPALRAEVTLSHRRVLPADEPTSREVFSRTVNEGLQQLFGMVRARRGTYERSLHRTVEALTAAPRCEMQVGGSIVFDLVEYQPTACVGILKVADQRCDTATHPPSRTRMQPA